MTAPLTMADQVEQLLANAWRAIQVTNPNADAREFRAAVLTGAARVIHDMLPPSFDPDRQAAAFSRIFDDQLRQRVAASRRDRAASGSIPPASQGPFPIQPVWSRWG